MKTTHLVLLLTLLLSACNAPAASHLPTAAPIPSGHTYHVSPTGVDSADGSLEYPFRTIQHCAKIAQPGDECAIHAGVYRETVTPPRSGEQGKPIRFRAYNGEAVTIAGSDIITGWTTVDGNIYQAQVDWTLGPGRDQLFVDGSPLVEARHPNQPDPQWVYPIEGLSPLWPVRASGDANPTEAEDDDRYRIASPAWDDFGKDDLVGATYAGWHYWGWSVQTGVVASSGPGEIRVAPGSVSKLWWCWHVMCVADWWQDNGRGSVSGVEKLLDAPGEFFLNPQTNTVKIWLPDGSGPAAHTIEARRRQLAFDLRQRSYIELVGLRIFAASVTMDGGAYNRIDNCTFEYISHFTRVVDGRNGYIEGGSSFLSGGQGGLYIGGHDNTLQNSRVSVSAGAGIILQGYRHLIHNNLIEQCSYGGTYLSNIFITYDPITDSKRGNYRGAHHITYNTLHAAGRSLLHISGMDEGVPLSKATVYDGLVIEHNHIFNGNLLGRDTGNVYAYGVTLGTEENPGSLAYNVIHDSWNTELDTGLVYWDNGTWFINNHHNLLWAAPGTAQKDHGFNTGGEGRVWAKSNTWLPNHTGGEESLTEADFPGGRFAYGHNFEQPPAGQPIPTPMPTPLTPNVQLEAEAADEMSGLKLEERYAGQCDSGDWLLFKGVYLSEGYIRLRARLLVPQSNPGQRIEIRLDALDSPLAGELITAAPDEPLTFNFAETVISGASGSRDVYVICRGEGRVGSLDWLRFEGGSGPTATHAPKPINLALNRPVQVSSQEEGVNLPENAVDGDLETRWASIAFEDPQWIVVDLGETRTIGRVVIHWETAFARAYTLQTAETPDGPWADIFAESKSDGGVDEIGGLNGQGRYLRLYGSKRGSEWGYSLWEIEIYAP